MILGRQEAKEVRAKNKATSVLKRPASSDVFGNVYPYGSGRYILRSLAPVNGVHPPEAEWLGKQDDQRDEEARIKTYEGQYDSQPRSAPWAWFG